MRWSAEQGSPGSGDFQETQEAVIRRIVREEIRASWDRVLDGFIGSGVTSYELLENVVMAEKGHLDRLLDEG